MGSSPLLYSLLRDVADKLEYPVVGKDKKENYTLYDHFKEVAHNRISNLGSGSDYTVFLDHLGIASVDMGFTNDLHNSAVYHYHSIYDSYTWMSKFGDPGFVFHNLMAKYLGLLVLNLSESRIIPFKTADYSFKLEEFFKKYESDIPKSWLNKTLDDAEEENGRKSNQNCGIMGHHNDDDDLKLTLQEYLEKVNVNLKKLQDSASLFDQYLKDLNTQLDNWDSLPFWKKFALRMKLFAVNMKLKYYERNFVNKEGLKGKGRDWFKHIVFASGRYTGYAGQQLPALGEAIEDKDYRGFVEALRYFNSVLTSLRH
ncbi:unnamed protein product [Ambrosiozyma monospora]|uniref:Unnamed protein product n=1 Tax=Ambrosiozyma monospora TaxID=43982 RepID=A0ACB5T9R4_AMBMO|nr:unnamed protein product [Ambrosiozyma monospora]